MKFEEIKRQIEVLEKALENARSEQEKLSIAFEIARLKNLELN